MFENRRFYSIFSTNYKYLLSSIYHFYIVYVKNTECYLHRLTPIPIFEHNCFDVKIFIFKARHEIFTCIGFWFHRVWGRAVHRYNYNAENSEIEHRDARGDHNEPIHCHCYPPV